MNDCDTNYLKECVKQVKALDYDSWHELPVGFPISFGKEIFKRGSIAHPRIQASSTCTKVLENELQSVLEQEKKHYGVRQTKATFVYSI